MVDTTTVVYFAGIAIAVVTASYLMNQEPRRPARRQRPVTEDMVDVVAVMLPQVDRAIIRSDLEQTHNVEATSTRLLDRQNAGTLPTSPESTAQATGSKPGSLLGQYKLTGEESVPETGSGWKNSREEREAQLKATRHAMILKARNKMRASESTA